MRARMMMVRVLIALEEYLESQEFPVVAIAAALISISPEFF